MHRANAYAVLSEELARFSQTPLLELQSQVGRPASRKDVKVAGEVLSLELAVTWADTGHRALRLEAVANGPSHWKMERLVEHVVIPLKGVG
jgi:hypothetical protein